MGQILYRLTGKKGFTILELLITVLIVGVLASLAIPRFGTMVQRVYVKEALENIGILRESFEVCYIQSGSFQDCKFIDQPFTVFDPSANINIHFDYKINSVSEKGYKIHATRNTKDWGDGSSEVQFTLKDGNITIDGSGIFNNI
jgi:prepilin-type N-terminal cleavage/methylation domain-containing protein